MKKLIIIAILTSSLFANCEYYIYKINNSIPLLEAMKAANAPYDLVIEEQKYLLRMLENAKAICGNKEYYDTLIKFYKN